MTKLDIGAYVDLQTLIAHRAVADTTTAVNGSAVDRFTVGGADQKRTLRSLALHVHVAGTGAGLTGGTATITIEDSDDGSTGWAAIENISGVSTGLAIAHDATDNADSAQVSYDLDKAKRYVRAVITEAWTGTGSRSMSVGAVLSYGGAVS